MTGKHRVQILGDCSVKRKPNFLFINSDQHRFDSLGANGNPVVKTPNLDRLAGEGIRFANAYTPCPVCTPARASMLNGQWSFTHRCLSTPEIAEMQCAFDVSAPLVNKILREQGYRQSYIGKWHLEGWSKNKFRPSPLDAGFDDYIPEAAYSGWYRENFGPPAPIHREPGEGNPYKMHLNVVDHNISHERSRLHWGADEAIRRLRGHAAEDSPFFLRWDPSEPHLPCVVPSDYGSIYSINDIPLWGSVNDTLEGKPYIMRKLRSVWGIGEATDGEIREMIRLYFATITLLDYEIGRVTSELERLGLMDSTVIIYTTDHGDMCGSHRLVDKHYNMYDDVTRVPLLIRYPAAFKKGSTSGSFTSHALDLAATVCSLAGADIPGTFQGISLLNNGDTGREDILSAYHGAQFGLFSQRMLRNQKYKYVYNAADMDELYDMEQDPWELDNLSQSSAHAAIVRDMRRRMYDRLKGYNDPLMSTIWMHNELYMNKKPDR